MEKELLLKVSLAKYEKGVLMRVLEQTELLKQRIKTGRAGLNICYDAAPGSGCMTRKLYLRGRRTASDLTIAKIPRLLLDGKDNPSVADVAEFIDIELNKIADTCMTINILDRIAVVSWRGIIKP